MPMASILVSTHRYAQGGLWAGAQPELLGPLVVVPCFLIGEVGVKVGRLVSEHGQFIEKYQTVLLVQFLAGQVVELGLLGLVSGVVLDVVVLVVAGVSLPRGLTFAGGGLAAVVPDPWVSLRAGGVPGLEFEIEGKLGLAVARAGRVPGEVIEYLQFLAHVSARVLFFELCAFVYVLDSWGIFDMVLPFFAHLFTFFVIN